MLTNLRDAMIDITDGEYSARDMFHAVSFCGIIEIRMTGLPDGQESFKIGSV